VIAGLLDFADHRGRWEATPFRATLPELVEMAVTQFPWVLANVFENPERTSDPGPRRGGPPNPGDENGR
jgi:hypothetical protein